MIALRNMQGQREDFYKVAAKIYLHQKEAGGIYMNLLDLFSLQGTLFALMIVGAILKKRRSSMPMERNV